MINKYIINFHLSCAKGMVPRSSPPISEIPYLEVRVDETNDNFGAGTFIIIAICKSMTQIRVSNFRFAGQKRFAVILLILALTKTPVPFLIGERKSRLRKRLCVEGMFTILSYHHSCQK